MKSSISTLIMRFRTVTPVCIHHWLRNDAQCLTKQWRVPYWFLKVICQISRSHGTKSYRIWTKLGVSGLQLQFEVTEGYGMMHTARSSIEQVPYYIFKVILQISRSYGEKSPILTWIERFRTITQFTDCFEIMHNAWRSRVEVFYCLFRGSLSNIMVTRDKKTQFWPELNVYGL